MCDDGPDDGGDDGDWIYVLPEKSTSFSICELIHTQNKMFSLRFQTNYVWIQIKFSVDSVFVFVFVWVFCFGCNSYLRSLREWS